MIIFPFLKTKFLSNLVQNWQIWLLFAISKLVAPCWEVGLEFPKSLVSLLVIWKSPIQLNPRNFEKIKWLEIITLTWNFHIFVIIFPWPNVQKHSKLVQKSEIAQKCSKMHISHIFLAIFGQKIFFSKIRLHGTHVTIKNYLDTKNQIKLWSCSSGIYPDGRTNVLTDLRVQIYSPSQILGSVQQTNSMLHP